MEHPARVIVMKVGLHLGEPWDSIIRRKMAEERAAGVVHWGYGGSVCHPVKQVQPFASTSNEPVSVFMIRTLSDFFGQADPAVARSTDGVTWQPMPPGVVTTGRYALTLRSLEASDEVLDLEAYEVGIGPSAGIPLPAYLRGRVDKACARVASTPAAPTPVHVILRAELVPPYAVILRTS